MHALHKEDVPFLGSSYHFVGEDHCDVAVSIYLVEASAGHGAPLHTHEYDEILIMQQGLVRLVVDDEIREAAPGDIVVVKARTPHGFVIGDGLSKQIDIHASPRFEQQNLQPTATSLRAMLPSKPPSPAR